jgi:hypothetical protein
MSDDARDILRELLAEALAGTNGHAVTPQVPPPPVAAVHRPAGVRPPEGDRGLERVTLGGDDDLNRFVRDILTRADRDAILAGRVRFTLAGAEGSRAEGTGPTRIDRGAVTERTVAAAAKAGGRLAARGPHAPGAREGARAGHRDRTGGSVTFPATFHRTSADADHRQAASSTTRNTRGIPSGLRPCLAAPATGLSGATSREDPLAFAP